MCWNNPVRVFIFIKIGDVQPELQSIMNILFILEKILTLV